MKAVIVVNNQSWENFFAEEKQKEHMRRLHNFLALEYQRHIVYPPKSLLLNAFNKTQFDQIKVVIIGQDPYHEPNQAMGLSFSVPSGEPLPPSLINIYKEIENDLGVKMKLDGDLTYLATQGVLLLNAILSVRQGEALSHQIPEYEILLKDVLEYIDQSDLPIVFILWGRYARNLKQYITNPHRLILEATHPSPLSANRGGFFGNHHFSRANMYLIKNNREPINWCNQKDEK